MWWFVRLMYETNNDLNPLWLQEVYDFGRKLFMLKYQNYWDPSRGQVAIIHDFNSGIGYNITVRTSRCKIFALEANNSFMDATEDNHHHLRMKTAQELLMGRNGSALFYTGSSNVRGIDADIWVNKRVKWHKKPNTSIMVSEGHWKYPLWLVQVIW